MKSLVRFPIATTCIFAALGMSRYLDHFIELFLRQDAGGGFLPAAMRNLSLGDAAGEIWTMAGFGLSLWSALTLLLRWLGEASLKDVLPPVSRAMVSFLLPVGLTLVSVLSLIVSPQFPYGVNLALTLAYEGSYASILTWLLVGATILHATVVTLRPWDGPRMLAARPRWIAWTLLLAALAGFAMATPSWLWKDGEGQGNMFKYLRIAAVVSASGTLDIGRAPTTDGRVTVGRFVSRLPRMARQWTHESVRLVRSVAEAALEGRVYLGRVEAQRANRSMFRRRDGSVFYINAPGPGLLLVPAYLLDRELNEWLGWEKQLTVILFWNLIGALLVREIYLSAREVDLGDGAPLVTALALAAAPPLLAYTYQIYPELPAALALVFVFRKLFLEPAPGGLDLLLAAAALAFLPWLHQKYALTAAIMGVMGAWRISGSAPTRPVLGARLAFLMVPLAFGAFTFLVYNHALTGSLLPDATFRAAGRTSFDPSNMPAGLLGLLVDAENGLFVYSPVYLLLFVGAGASARVQPPMRSYWMATVLSYLAVIASFPHWPGAVSSVSRYILSITPLAALLMVPAVRKSFSDGLVAGTAMALLAGSLSFTVAFQKDLVASHEPSQLLSGTVYSDPYQYLPDVLHEGVLGAGGGHGLKLGAIGLGLAVLVYGVAGRVERESPLRDHDVRTYPTRCLAGAGAVLAVVIAAAAILERAPSNTTGKSEAGSSGGYRLPGAGVEVVVDGRYGFENRGVWVPGRESTRFVTVSHRPLKELTIVLRSGPRTNRVRVAEREGRSIVLRLAPGSHRRVRLPLTHPYRFQGPSGRRWIYEFSVESFGGFVPREEGTTDDARELGCLVVLSAM